MLNREVDLYFHTLKYASILCVVTDVHSEFEVCKG